MVRSTVSMTQPRITLRVLQPASPFRSFLMELGCFRAGISDG